MVFLYYDILQYQEATLRLIEQNFNMKNLPDPDYDTDDVLGDIEVAMAPLGFPFDRKKIDRCPILKIIGSSTLSIPQIDVNYAESKGIKVCFLDKEQKRFLESITPTAELAWGLIIAITRRIPWAHKNVLKCKWNGRTFGHKAPRMLSAMSLGVVGLGRLGSLVASYAKAFGMKVYYYSPNSINSDYERCEVLIELAKKSDIVSLHAPHIPETEEMINKAFIYAMKEGSLIVNTSRGELIDETALLEALESKHLGGAALDVLEGEYEPNFKDKIREHPLVRYAKMHNNLIITPHYGGATVDAWMMTQKKTVELIVSSMKWSKLK